MKHLLCSTRSVSPSAHAVFPLDEQGRYSILVIVSFQHVELDFPTIATFSRQFTRYLTLYICTWSVSYDFNKLVRKCSICNHLKFFPFALPNRVNIKADPYRSTVWKRCRTKKSNDRQRRRLLTRCLWLGYDDLFTLTFTNGYTGFSPEVGIFIQYDTFSFKMAKHSTLLKICGIISHTILLFIFYKNVSARFSNHLRLGTKQVHCVGSSSVDTYI